MIPVAGIAQTVVGGLQSLFGGGQAARAQKQLEKMVDSYQPNQSIMDYYNKALSKYSADPYSSAMYRMQTQNANRGLATGIGALQDRRSALSGLPAIMQSYNDANLKAAAGAEATQSQALGQLGQATAAKAAEDFKKFEMKYNLLSAKASGGNQTSRAGIQNAFNGLGSIQNYYTAKDAYGSGGSTNSSTYGQQPIGKNPDGSPHWG